MSNLYLFIYALLDKPENEPNQKKLKHESIVTIIVNTSAGIVYRTIAKDEYEHEHRNQRSQKRTIISKHKIKRQKKAKTVISTVLSDSRRPIWTILSHCRPNHLGRETWIFSIRNLLLWLHISVTNAPCASRQQESQTTAWSAGPAPPTSFAILFGFHRNTLAPPCKVHRTRRETSNKFANGPIAISAKLVIHDSKHLHSTDTTGKIEENAQMYPSHFVPHISEMTLRDQIRRKRHLTSPECANDTTAFRAKIIGDDDKRLHSTKTN